MIRVFTNKTKWTPDDRLSFIGDPPLFRPVEDLPVRISCVFTWHKKEAERLKRSWSRFYSDVQVGGPAYGDPGVEFEPGRFIKKGVTITSRGCIRNCPWCHVPGREGKIRELRIKSGYIVQDNNLLACSRKHIESVFEMLSNQKRGASFNGGIDARLLKTWHRSLFENIRIHEIWLACDTHTGVKPLEKALEIIGSIPRKKRRCYTMLGYGETLKQAEQRVQYVYSIGYMPFAQLYQPQKKKHYSPAWTALARKWSRPAIYESIK